MVRCKKLDGLRGMAALSVVFGHSIGQPRIALLAVSIFFVLSGFLIGGILIDNRDAPHYFLAFYARRALRIFPIYYLVTTATLLVLHQPQWLLPFYLYGQMNLVTLHLGTLPAEYLHPTWTLCIEEQFYLIFPMLLYLCPKRNLAKMLLGGIVISLLFRAALVWAFPPTSHADEILRSETLPWQWDLLLIGALAAYLNRLPIIRQRLVADDCRALKLILLGAVAILPILALSDVVDPGYAGLLGPGVVKAYIDLHLFQIFGNTAIGVAFAAFVILLAEPTQQMGKFLQSPIAQFLASISYGLYLIHEIVRAVALPLGPAYVMAPLAVLAAVGLAYLSYTYFESPLIRLGQRVSYSAPRTPNCGIGSSYSAAMSRPV